MRQRLATLAVAGLAIVGPAEQVGQIKVSPIVNEGKVLASFVAADSWNAETRQVLQFGLLVTFEYYVEIKKPRMISDATLAHTNMTASAKLDTLTGIYTVSRMRDNRMLKTEKREQETGVRDWLTVFDEPMELQPESPLKTNSDYYILVRLYKSPRANASVLSMLPLGRDDLSGRTSFTYFR